jgi:hypothetical protein
MSVRFGRLVVVSGMLLAGAAALATPRIAAAAGNISGIGGIMPAYYDHNLLTINFKRQDTSQATLLVKNKSINTIYQSDPGLPGGAPFISVLDAIQGDGFNPLWQEIQITFKPGHTPRQLFSDNEVADAFAAGEITLAGTGELYRCSVIGSPATPGPTLSRVSRAPVGGAALGSSGPTVTSWGGLKIAYR